MYQQQFNSALIVPHFKELKSAGFLQIDTHLFHNQCHVMHTLAPFFLLPGR
jgi:hypothetical protein